MHICDPRVRIVRDGHEPNEAEEQRPCRVPVEPVHVIFLAERPRREVGRLSAFRFSWKPKMHGDQGADAHTQEPPEMTLTARRCVVSRGGVLHRAASTVAMPALPMGRAASQ
jgi:hypothetical protein